MSRSARPSHDLIDLTYVYPELREFGGGGTGAAGLETRKDPHGIPYRALDRALTQPKGFKLLEKLAPD